MDGSAAYIRVEGRLGREIDFAAQNIGHRVPGGKLQFCIAIESGRDLGVIIPKAASAAPSPVSMAFVAVAIGFSYSSKFAYEFQVRESAEAVSIFDKSVLLLRCANVMPRIT